jgi:hypothetical protein
MAQQLFQVSLSALLLCAIAIAALQSEPARTSPLVCFANPTCVYHMTIDGRAECIQWEEGEQVK